MQYKLLLLPAVFLLFMAGKSSAQLSNLTVNGSATSFTMTSGDNVSWSYNIPTGGTATIQIWYDVNGNGTIDPGTDVLWQAFTQTDGDTVGNSGPPDMDGQANGAILVNMPVGLAPGKYVLSFSQGGVTEKVAGTVNPLASPAQTISGKVIVPSGKSAQYIFVEVHRSQQYQPNFWDGVTDANGNYTVAMTSDTAGNPWRADVVNNPYAPATVTPSDTSLTIVPGHNITGVNFSIVDVAAQVDGSVKDESGNPLVNTWVTLMPTDSSQVAQYSGNTDVSGIFRIGVLSKDIVYGRQWLVDASPRNNDTTSTQMDGVATIKSISASDSIFKPLVIYNTNSQIQGIVKENGVPSLANLMVVAINPDSAQAFAYSKAVTGTFTIPVSNKISTYNVFVVNVPNASSTVKIAHPGDTGIEIDLGTDGVNEKPARTPNGFSLGQNYPNPFNPTTTITYDVASKSWVSIIVYNVLGQKVATLFDGTRTPGEYSVKFDASPFASGLYFYRMSAGNFSSVKKLILMK
ncbi:MAG: T9SS type A sorting domain-containing protein [Bacteroidetes bacterium]|nr:T9SS type A sorting domain-containing protein [Bacteroidota bacterium]